MKLLIIFSISIYLSIDHVDTWISFIVNSFAVFLIILGIELLLGNRNNIIENINSYNDISEDKENIQYHTSSKNIKNMNIKKILVTKKRARMYDHIENI
jgi:hypothetical protein